MQVGGLISGAKLVKMQNAECRIQDFFIKKANKNIKIKAF